MELVLHYSKVHESSLEGWHTKIRDITPEWVILIYSRNISCFFATASMLFVIHRKVSCF